MPVFRDIFLPKNDMTHLADGSVATLPCGSQHRGHDQVRRSVPVGEGLDVDDDLFAHLVAALDRGRAHVRQQHDLAFGGQLHQLWVGARRIFEHIETGTGNCHLFVDASADIEMALAIMLNAKVQRPSVCNAEEVCLVHTAVAEKLLPMLHKALVADRIAAGQPPVELRPDRRAAAIISGTPST